MYSLLVSILSCHPSSLDFNLKLWCKLSWLSFCLVLSGCKDQIIFFFNKIFYTEENDPAKINIILYKIEAISFNGIMVTIAKLIDIICKDLFTDAPLSCSLWWLEGTVPTCYCPCGLPGLVPTHGQQRLTSCTPRFHTSFDFLVSGVKFISAF